jgi:glycosidase
MNHYQINLRAIACRAPSNPLEALIEFRDGAAPQVSPLATLTEGLHLIADLGVELLHVMPPFRMGQLARKGIGSPYAVADYLDIDPEFGSASEWFALVRRAHALGLRVILGYVPNHTARDHVWTRHDPRFHVRAADGSLAYDFDWSDTAKLDYTYPPLRRAVTDTLLHWIRGECADSGVDGYRMDMAHMINDPGFWDECIPELEAAAGPRGLLLLAECYGFERNVDLFRRGFHAAYDDDFYKIAQYGYARDAAGRSRLLLDPDAAHNGDFAPRLADWKRGGIAAAVTGLIAAYQREAPGKLLARYVDNHDEGRGVYRFGVEASRVLMDLAACLPGTILFTLAGQEAGAWNRPPIHEYIRPCDKGYRCAAGGRVEGVEFEGNLFFRTAEERRQAVSEARQRFALRRDHPALREGDWTPLDLGDEHIVAFTRRAEGETLHCLFNLGQEERRLRRVFPGAVIFGDVGSSHLPAFASRVVVAL